MKIKERAATMTAKAAKAMAEQACGAASMWGTYQPKEPRLCKEQQKSKK